MELQRSFHVKKVSMLGLYPTEVAEAIDWTKEGIQMREILLNQLSLFCPPLHKEKPVEIHTELFQFFFAHHITEIITKALQFKLTRKRRTLHDSTTSVNAATVTIGIGIAIPKSISRSIHLPVNSLSFL